MLFKKENQIPRKFEFNKKQLNLINNNSNRGCNKDEFDTSKRYCNLFVLNNKRTKNNNIKIAKNLSNRSKNLETLVREQF